MSKNLVRAGIAASALSLLFVTAACGGSDDTSSGSPSTSTSSLVPAETPSASPSMDNAAGLVGPGCADYAKANPTGAGSVDGMAAAPVATAASGNPLLTTLVAAVSGKLNPKVDLVSTLNGGEFTVFAPVDSAFAKIPAATVNTLKTDDALLTKILTYHVVPGQLAPDAVVGSQTTVEKQAVTVTGSGDNLMVNNAKVICGGVKTANATVYLIDSVLMPPAA
ncbi:putative surface protein with fasciclin (FAS1) repeats [Kribbella orskensis]|uniref:Surface protein with fasciclin (FAS1) repeats n=1 Tax=Kribbella orskensis TaxID=2512216 RepID=A0ABY2BNW3_9ACTN|nr:MULTISPECIES: fasciclin domain-containing protein [Kribbella]TCN42120.1 putative surface protein with fasciclin (FAS1) repeats [Kribbella sp. VKM Ac-2500]TCO25998.1 putative surface protein with fasciclin (FAS1) repeats [Kribbella orskensis]